MILFIYLNITRLQSGIRNFGGGLSENPGPVPIFPPPPLWESRCEDCVYIFLPPTLLSLWGRVVTEGLYDTLVQYAAY